jgi:hypothetical protein
MKRSSVYFLRRVVGNDEKKLLVKGEDGMRKWRSQVGKE